MIFSKKIILLVIAFSMGIPFVALSLETKGKASAEKITSTTIKLGDGTGTKGSGPGDDNGINIGGQENKGPTNGDGTGTKGSGPEEGEILFKDPSDQALPCLDTTIDSIPSNNMGQMPSQFLQTVPKKLKKNGDEQK